MIPLRDIGEHPRDILGFLAQEQASGAPCALALVAAVEGPSSRAIGAMMGVSSRGAYAGYVSNGCIDAAVAQHAVQTIQTGEMTRVRYGEGSPYMDLKLPCGGALELLILPDPDRHVVKTAASHLKAREEVSLSVLQEGALSLATTDGALFQKTYAPTLRLAVAGRGAETLALIQLAAAAPYDLIVYSPDEDVLSKARSHDADALRIRADEAISWPNDPYTAITLLFHEHEWETPLLKTAVETDCFFIGAMGSRRTHEVRLGDLIEEGVPAAQVQRVKGQIGLIHSARDATTLGISVLAQIVDLYKKTVSERTSADRKVGL